jgi:hypothetical protein
MEAAAKDHLGEKGKLHGWRLLCLIDAYRTQKSPLEYDDIELLGQIALATSDLHEACSALMRGCRLEYAVIIYT